MWIMQNMTKTQIDYYMNQPTAKKWQEKMTKEAKYVPPGDKDAAAVYVRQQSDKKKSFTYSFGNTSEVSRTVEQGYIESEGNRIELTDDVKKQLTAAAKQIEQTRARVAQQNFLLHEAATARQQSDAMKKANDKMTRIMGTAARMMHGKKVSPADERELMESDPDLYTLAKNAEMIERLRQQREEKEDKELSARHDAARAREAEPKDYGVEEIPQPQSATKLDISVNEDGAAVMTVRVGA